MTELALLPWSEGDLPLLLMLMGDPQVMAHLGGPETSEQIHRRHLRYLQLDGVDHMFKIAWGPGFDPVGSIGYWKKDWHDQSVYETGWMILPAYQGHGIATKAAQKVIEHAREQARFPYVHAFPSVDNPASNAICRKVGFEWIEECQFEYPPGYMMTVNDWRLDLSKI